MSYRNLPDALYITLRKVEAAEARSGIPGILLQKIFDPPVMGERVKDRCKYYYFFVPLRGNNFISSCPARNLICFYGGKGVVVGIGLFFFLCLCCFM